MLSHVYCYTLLTQMFAANLFMLVSEKLEAKPARIRCADELIVSPNQGWHDKMRLYPEMLASTGIKQSISRKSNCFDNAPIEIIFGLPEGRIFPSRIPNSIGAGEFHHKLFNFSQKKHYPQ